MQHHEFGLEPHWKVLSSLEQVVAPAKHTLSGSQQYSRPVDGLRAQAFGGGQPKGRIGHL